MTDIRTRILAENPLTERVEGTLDCYLLAKKRYLVFWDEPIGATDMPAILKRLEADTAQAPFSAWKTLIVVGRTEEAFEPEDLFWFNSVSTFVVFYLIDRDGMLYRNDSRIYPLGVNYRRYVQRLDTILG